LKRIPDGETGERAAWINFQFPLMASYAFFEPDEPEGDELTADQVAQGTGTTYRTPKLRVRDGVDVTTLKFTNLGYRDSALESYATFSRLKQLGVIGSRIRFQVSLPTPLAPLMIFVRNEDIPRVLPAYRATLLGELDQICQTIPASELSVQWDVAAEIGLLEGVLPPPFVDVTDTIVAELVQLGNAVPEEVELGYHLCYGDFGHKHILEPVDTRIMVDLANLVIAKLGRPLNWLHLPVPRDRNDDKYFAPLKDLTLPDDTDLYLGLVHQTDGLAGTHERLTTARRHRGRFGIATECGFGRRDPETIPALLELHRTLLETD
jgi:hypothetical protein